MKDPGTWFIIAFMVLVILLIAFSASPWGQWLVNP